MYISLSLTEVTVMVTFLEAWVSIKLKETLCFWNCLISYRCHRKRSHNRMEKPVAGEDQTLRSHATWSITWHYISFLRKPCYPTQPFSSAIRTGSTTVTKGGTSEGSLLVLNIVCFVASLLGMGAAPCGQSTLQTWQKECSCTQKVFTHLSCFPVPEEWKELSLLRQAQGKPQLPVGLEGLGQVVAAK